LTKPHADLDYWDTIEGLSGIATASGQQNSAKRKKFRQFTNFVVKNLFPPSFFSGAWNHRNGRSFSSKS
jgi:hypothetical protein